MVKTRRARKRTSPKQPSEDEDSDLEEKKPKLNIPTEKVSKYFKDINKQDDREFKNNKNTTNQKNTAPNLAVPKKSKEAFKLKNESDTDESSSDEFLKVPFSLDDLGDFETLDKESTNLVKGNKMVFNNISSRLSDDSGEDTNIAEQDYYDFSQIIQSQELIENTKKELEEKANCNETHLNAVSNGSKIKKQQRKTVKEKYVKKIIHNQIDEQLEISELLAIAEGPILCQQSNANSSDDENPVEKKYSVPEEGVQVTIELPNLTQKKKSKGFDVEAAMKRRFNLIRKENQVFMHKVHTLCWIAHGFYLNCTINSDDLMGLALSLIPSKHCYPSKHADLNCLEKLVEWFIGKVIIDKDHKLAINSSNLPLKHILEIEINLKKAFSPRDLVLIFICMVRSLGIDARLIVSLRPVPLRPPASDLCTVKNTKSEKSSKDNLLKQSATFSNIDDRADGKKSLGHSKSIKKIKEQTQLKASNNKSSKQTKSSPNKLNTKTKRGKIKSVEKSNSFTENKQAPGIKSPYFSSSDEVPLKKIQSKRNLRNKYSVSEKELQGESCTDKIFSDISKSKSVTNPESRFSSIDQNNCSKSSGGIKSPQSSNLASVKKNSSRQIRRVSNNLNIESDNVKQSTEIAERQTKLAKHRRSFPLSYQKVTTSSDDDEVGIPKQSKKKENFHEKLKCSNAKLSTKKIEPQNKIEDNSNNDFETKKVSIRKKPIDRRVLSSDDDNDKSKKVGNDFWVEVFLEAEEKWISVDLRKGQVHCIHKLYNGATQPVRYVLAFNSDGSAKDVTRRYAPQWLTVTRRLRADDKWWQDTMKPYNPRQNLREKDEDEDLDRQLHDKPLPTSVSEYKNHPLYALRRHLLKFEAIYPSDAPPLGFVRGEPVYSRGCVADLHTRETWIKEAKLVRRGEEPYKIVKARPKWDKVSQKVINDLPLPLYGHWQVEDYIPPPAVDGKVPRNEYGNVELYKPCMLPPGTVHLQVPQLARVARKLNIDCAPAVVGWEFSGGSSHPVLDGFIVCEEFQEVLLDAWNTEMDESANRAKEKVEKRVYGNWKRLIRGLLIRERLKLRYDFGEPEPEKKKKKQQPRPSTSKT